MKPRQLLSAAKDLFARREILRLLRALGMMVMLALGLVVPRGTRAQDAPERLDRGRFTAVYYPAERTLAHSLVSYALANDTFPGLPRPREHVVLAIAPDTRRFREWAGPHAPEWGAAITFPDLRRIVMQGREAGTEAGDPEEILRHELAHLALHEYLGDLPPRWFDEGYASYAAREWTREDALATNLALALRGTPSFDELDQYFEGGATSAQNAYALAYRAVSDLAALDPEHGLRLFFENWHEYGSMDRAVRASYGMTLDGFEHRWQRQTRRRYGSLALVSDVTVGGFVLLLIVFPLYVARRRRERRQLAALRAADEVAEREARERAIEALLRGDDGPFFRDEPPGSTPPPHGA